MPPISVVRRRPSLSTKIPDTGEKKNVAPMVREPTRAEKREIFDKFNVHKKFALGLV
jgi:hypothetical protein